MNITAHSIFKSSFLFSLLAPGCGGGSAEADFAQRSFSTELYSAAGEDYGSTFSAAREIGLDFVTLSVPWDEIETAPGQFRAVDLASANSFFPSQNQPLVLTISLIDTNLLRVPSDLNASAFSSAAMKSRFRALLDYVFSELQDTEIIALSIGNEVDGYLQDDAQRWSEYLDFFQDAVTYAHSKKASLKVGVKFGFDGLRSSNSRSLIRASDVAMVTYYPLRNDFTIRPLSSVDADFNAMVSAAQGKPLMILECGIPSSPSNSSSELIQSQFIVSVFSAWSRHSASISHLVYFSLTDFSPSLVKELSGYYGVGASRFQTYLGSLGVRKYDGTLKPAFATLKAEVRKLKP